MIKAVTMYSVICDRCGKTFIDQFNDIVAWLDEGTAKEQAMESEWAEIGDKHISISVRKGTKVHNILEKLMPLKGVKRSCGAEVCYRVPKSEFEKEELL